MNKNLILLSLALFLFATACKKDDTIDPNRGRSYLHIVSTVQNTDTFDLNFNYYHVNNTVIGRFHFNRNWPLEGYADLEEGGTPDEFGNGQLFCVGTVPTTVFGIPDDTVLYERPIVLTKNEKSTLCFADSAGTIAMKKFTDDSVSPGRTN